MVELTPGQPDVQVVPEGGFIESEPPIELSDLIKKTSSSLEGLDEVATAADGARRNQLARRLGASR